MKELFVIGLLCFSSSLFAANIQSPSQPADRDVCGTIVKIGDLNEFRDSITMRTDAGDMLKIYIVVGNPSFELDRATSALAYELRYCARITYEKQAYLVHSSLEKK